MSSGSSPVREGRVRCEVLAVPPSSVKKQGEKVMNRLLQMTGCLCVLTMCLAVSNAQAEDGESRRRTLCCCSRMIWATASWGARGILRSRRRISIRLPTTACD